MCTTGCATPGAHKSWGDCLRSKGIQVGDPGRNYRQSWDAELDAYADARRQGMQPRGTKMRNVEEIKKIADVTGVGDPWQ